MIKISDKKQCCGCSACVQACPKKCLSLIEDDTGFLYPSVDNEMCVNCRMCEKVCPVINRNEENRPIRIAASINKNEDQRRESSSGGIFVILAEQIIDKGGVVFGAKFDKDWMVTHSYTDNKDELKVFQGSKYVQSRIGDSYKHAKVFLEQGKDVLFSGTPCQIAGLKRFLQKDYEKLLTVEVICHGVPSPGVWRDYLQYVRRPKGAGGGQNTVSLSLNETPSLEGISFRDKQNGWSKFGFVVRYSADQREAEKFGLSSVDANTEIREYHKNNLYMQCFLSNVILRPICFACPFKSGASHADISLGDFWTVNQYLHEINDDKGVTLVYVLTEKGSKIFDLVKTKNYELNKDIKYNLAFNQSAEVKYPPKKFWKLYKAEGFNCMKIVNRKIKPSFLERCIISLKSRFTRIINH